MVSGPTLLTGICHCAKCGGAMTIRTGKRALSLLHLFDQGATGREGRSIPMDKLDGVVIDHIEREFLDPSRLEIVLSAVLDWRQERSERCREHIAELNKHSAETELRLKRLYDAIEAGVSDLDDPALKDRIEGLRALRRDRGHRPQADAARRRRLPPRPPARLRPARRGRRARGLHQGIERQATTHTSRHRRREIGGK